VGVYHEISRLVETNEIESNLALLEKAKDTIENRLNEIEHMVLTLRTDPYIWKFSTLSAPPGGSSFYDLYELARHLRLYGSSCRIIHSFYIYFKNSNRIVTMDSSYEPPAFYKHNFSYSDMEYEEWKEFFFESSHDKHYIPTKSVVLESGRRNMLTYLQSYPVLSSGIPEITIWVMIDAMVIRRDLRNISKDGWVYVTDENGHTIASLSKSGDNLEVGNLFLAGDEGFIDQVINGQRLIVAYTASFSNGWKYISVSPYSTVMAKTQFIRMLLTGIGIAVLILGFITAYLLALRSTKPLKELVNVVKEKLSANISHSKNEYDYIKKSVNKIADLNISLQKEIQQQLPMFRASFFERLLKGEYATEDEIHSILSQLGIDIKGNFFAVALMRINIYDNSVSRGRMAGLFTAKTVIKKIVSRKFHSRFYIHDRAEDEIVLLMCFAASESDIYKEITERLLLEIYKELYNKLSIHSSYAAGRIYPYLRNVWHSYGESVEAMDTMRINRDFCIKWYTERIESMSVYYFPLNLEERLMNNVKAGNSEEVENILTLVYKENVENRKIPSYMILLLVNEIRCSIIKVLNQIDFNDNDTAKKTIIDKVEDLGNCGTFDDAFGIIAEVYKYICNAVDSLKKSHRKELINNIKEYIQMKHKDLGLNRYIVASHFGMTEEYLSSFFKEQTGILFSVFLMEIRMKNASELLSEKKMSINSIAKTVGYSSEKAFSRAFKKVNGISPSDYRKLTVT
jgi:AraC-like DNA-binding protein/gas vesicle protein